MFSINKSNINTLFYYADKIKVHDYKKTALMIY